MPSKGTQPLKIQTVGLTAKRGSAEAYSIARRIMEFASKELGLDILIDSELVDEISWDEEFTVGVDKVDALIVVGGDGTLFRTLHRLGSMDVPIMTVRAGKRGFILDVLPIEVEERLRDFVEGRYLLLSLMKLDMEFDGLDYSMPSAVNDIAFVSWGPSRTKVVRLSVEVDGQHLYYVEGDGIVVSTPLGSSAYVLSAGGPLVDVELDSITVAPIAPSQLFVRPVVLSPSRTVTVRVSRDSGPVACVVDGQEVALMLPGTSANIRRSQTRFTLVRFKRFNTFSRLQEKE